VIDSKNIKVLYVTSFLFALLIAAGAVNATSYQWGVYIRSALLIFSIACALFILFMKRSVSKKATYLILITFSLILLHFPFNYLSEEFFNAIALSVLSIFLAYITSTIQLSENIKVYNLAIFSVSLYTIFLIMVSGIGIDGVLPVILFSELDNVSGYSQGITRIFSVAVVATVFKISNEKISIQYKIFLALLAFVFFILSLSGGARGEVLSCLVVVIILASRKVTHLIFGLLSVIGLFIGMNAIIGDLETWTQLPTIWRLLWAYEHSNWGGRDTAAVQALLLLAENPSCLFFGCGLLHYQDYYGYEFGGYPHNWVIEFVISFGAIIFILLSLSIFTFVFRNYKNFSINEKFLIVLSLYFFGVFIKSGSIVSAALLYGSFCPVAFSVRESMQSYSTCRKSWTRAGP